MRMWQCTIYARRLLCYIVTSDRLVMFVNRCLMTLPGISRAASLTTATFFSRLHTKSNLICAVATRSKHIDEGYLSQGKFLVFLYQFWRNHNCIAAYIKHHVYLIQGQRATQRATQSYKKCLFCWSTCLLTWTWTSPCSLKIIVFKAFILTVIKVSDKLLASWCKTFWKINRYHLEHEHREKFFFRLGI